MKKLMLCMKCVTEGKRDGIEFINLDVTDDGAYLVECKNGHKYYQVMDTEKFSTLFEMGVEALINGFKQEAVLTFSTAIERLHEWVIKLVSRKYEISYNDINSSWKLLSKQSERQLGAFYWVYLLEFNKVPQSIQNINTFRNKVVHKGYIPNIGEVNEFGEEVYRYIISILENLDSSYNELIFDLVFEEMKKIQKKYNINENLSSGSNIRIFNLPCNIEELKSKSFIDQVEGKKEVLKILKELN